VHSLHLTPLLSHAQEVVELHLQFLPLRNGMALRSNALFDSGSARVLAYGHRHGRLELQAGDDGRARHHDGNQDGGANGQAAILSPTSILLTGGAKLTPSCGGIEVVHASYRIKDQTAESEAIWKFFDNRSYGIFVEVGAHDPVYRSQTWLLENKGWKGLLIEPQAKYVKRLRAERPNSKVFPVACGERREEAVFHIAENDGYSGLSATQPEATYLDKEMVTVRTLDDVLEEAGVNHVDFLSIDVEGHQLEVLRGLDLSFHRPSLVLVEDRFRDGWATHIHMLKQGYRLIDRTDGLNGWYIPKESKHRVSLAKQWKLFRFVWLGTPFRILKFWRKEYVYRLDENRREVCGTAQSSI
jgi:FkbM family methyltransferase